MVSSQSRTLIVLQVIMTRGNQRQQRCGRRTHKKVLCVIL